MTTNEQIQEEISQARDCAGEVSDRLRAAMKDADPVLANILLLEIKQAAQLRSRLNTLAEAHAAKMADERS